MQAEELTEEEKMFKAERAGGNYGLGTKEVQVGTAVLCTAGIVGTVGTAGTVSTWSDMVCPREHQGGPGRLVTGDLGA